MPFCDPYPFVRKLFSKHLRPPPRLTVDEWADKYRRVAESSARPGPWRTSQVPYLRDPMRDFTDPRVKKIVLMFGTQMGKSEYLVNCALYTVDCRPVPVVWAMGSIVTVRDFVDERVRPAVLSSPRVKARMPTGAAGRFSMKKQRMEFDTCTIALTGSNSAVNMATRPAGLVIGDEIDKWPQELAGKGGTEGSALSLLLKRLDSYGEEGKALLTSTPSEEGLGIDAEYQNSDKGKFWVPCPRCGAYQLLRFGADGDGGIRWEGGLGLEMHGDDFARHVERVRASAWYECEVCRGRIENADKPSMLEAGKWVRLGQTITRDGKVDGDDFVSSTRGYHASSIYSPFMSFGAVAEDFVKSRGEPGRDWINSRLAEPWLVPGQRTDENVLIEIAKTDPPDGEQHYPRGHVPPKALVLIGTIDVQRDCVFIEVSGYGEHERRWVIDYAQVPCPMIDAEAKLSESEREQTEGDCWAMVVEYVTQRWPVLGSADSKPVIRWGIDSGYRRMEVLRFCERMGPHFVPMKGSDSQIRAWHESPVEDAEQMGLQNVPELLSVSTDHYKTEAMTRLHRKSGTHGSVRLPENTSMEWCRQMTSEHRVTMRVGRSAMTRRIWQIRPGRKDNHWWDCHYLNLALADRAGLRAFAAGDVIEEPEGQQSGLRVAGKFRV